MFGINMKYVILVSVFYCTGLVQAQAQSLKESGQPHQIFI